MLTGGVRARCVRGQQGAQSRAAQGGKVWCDQQGHGAGHSSNNRRARRGSWRCAAVGECSAPSGKLAHVNAAANPHNDFHVVILANQSSRDTPAARIPSSPYSAQPSCRLFQNTASASTRPH